jgi:hypothetical protein
VSHIDVHARSAYNAGMGSKQYTIRAVPDRIDRALRKRAKAEGKSLNAVVLQVLMEGVEAPDRPKRNENLREFFGTWVEDPAFDEAMKDFEKVDEELWK